MLTQFLVNAIEEQAAVRAGQVLESALRAADPRAAVQAAVHLTDNRLEIAGQLLDLGAFRRIRAAGVGKASQAMVMGLLDALEGRITEGVIITKHVIQESIGPIRVLPGGHPVPSKESVVSTQALAQFLSGGEPSDLVICLISGGGSALMMDPHPPVTLEDIQALTRLLLNCGAEIGEMNTLRKHLDRVKGGGLARAAYPARLVTLILSDVIGSPLDVIASGPTVSDPTTYQDAQAILKKYRIEDRVPQNIRSVLEQGAAGQIPETVKPGDPLLEKTTNTLVASNPQAAEAALAQARRAGFNTLLLSTYLQGEAATVGVALAGILRQVAATGQPVPRPACIIAGGETTVTIKGKGMGGRNQEMALGAVELLSGLPGVALVTLATDGEDGPTNAAGAVVTGDTLSHARVLSLNPQAYLQNNDSYHFFESLGGLLTPGPTGTNVNDLVFLFAF